MEKNNWYVVYTKSRHEKKVFQSFLDNDIEAFLPTRSVNKQYSDRIKKIDELLLPSYVFLKINEREFEKIRNIDGVVNFLYWLGKPAKIKEIEIENLKNFILKEGDISFELLDKKVGDKIILNVNLFKGEKAILNKISKNKVELILESLNIKLVLNKNINH